MIVVAATALSLGGASLASAEGVGNYVSVSGVGVAPIAQGASQEAADAAYRQALAAGIQDGQGKAEYLLSKAGGSSKLGALHAIAEGGGYVECTGAGEEGNNYVAYTGKEPDFGYGAGLVHAAAPAGAVSAPRAPTVKSHKSKGHKGTKHKRKRARIADATSCTVRATVELSYSIS